MISPTDHGGRGDQARAASGTPRRAQVVGTGLVGGSLGLALRARGWHVSGTDLDPARLERALGIGVLDAAGSDPDAELVVVCVPAHAAGPTAAAILAEPGRRPDVVVTDVSGVKASVVAAADHPRFVGGHPMAGSEQLGLDGADAELFVGATWVLTPTAETDLEAFGRLREVVASLGAEVLVLSPDDHDRLVAVVSHVPHLVAATLMNAAAQGAAADGALLRLAAGGFRDMTRVAAGSPAIWPDICVDNAAAIVDSLDRLLADLAAARDRVARADRDGIYSMLDDASRSRRALPARAARPENLAELRVPVPDREGVLAELTAAARDLDVNIYDIEIAHSAEGPRGILVLVVDRAAAAALRDAFAERGFHAVARELS
jgi:prephenate dehydrogenase